MKSGRIAIAAAAAISGLAMGLASPAEATIAFPQEFTCPIGGETFEDYVVASYTTFGQRPDGRPYGTLEIHPIVECPGNGFLLFQEQFTPEEVTRLTPLVASEPYQALRSGETPYYRLWWLLNETGRPVDELANVLLTATWESDDDTVRKRRYQTAFLAAAEAIPAQDGENWFYYNLRAANALREMGEFDQASALLARVNASTHWPTETEVLTYVRSVVNGLQTLIAERNGHPEPTNLIPPQVAVERCQADAAGLSASERTACAGPDITELIAANGRAPRESSTAADSEASLEAVLAPGN